MLSTAEDNISSSTIAAGDGREVATAAAAAANTTTASHSHNLPSGRSEPDNKGTSTGTVLNKTQHEKGTE
jgi:hypothetical protein